MKIDKEYLDKKLQSLIEQRDKVIKVLDQYSKLYDKLEGAIEITNTMLNETNQEQPDPVVEKVKK